MKHSSKAPSRRIVRLTSISILALAVSACAMEKDGSSLAASAPMGTPASANAEGQDAAASRDYAGSDASAATPSPEPIEQEESRSEDESAPEADRISVASTSTKTVRQSAKRERKSKESRSKKNRGQKGDAKLAAAKPGAAPPAEALLGGAIATGSPAIAVPMPDTKPVNPTSTANEDYARVHENEFLAVNDKPLSTFSIDVDTASYANSRRYIQDGTLPPPDAVRIEEYINYFNYDYPQPTGADPFSITAEVAGCPWNDQARLVHLGLQGKTLTDAEIPGRNLVFLLDVSGSMNNADKLPLLKKAFTMLANQLDEDDKVSIVVYAGASGVVLPPTSGEDNHAILSALERLRAGGSTNGGSGITLAYQLARDNFIKDGINRVILATDGDFNVGVTSRGQLETLIERERQSGVFLSVLGFGTGNLKDSQMEMLADKGNGNYAYIDSAMEAQKVLVAEAGSTLVTIAKDVKIQVEFNPAQVASYRLIGYENRRLADRDFNDDTKDAGEIGAGHTVTALYEVIPTSAAGSAGSVDPLKYQRNPDLSQAANSGELMSVKLRYKQPMGSKSKLLNFAVKDDERSLERASKNFRFSAAVAGFGMLVKNSQHRGSANFAMVHSLAKGALDGDANGYRRQFLDLVSQSARLRGESHLAIAR